MSVIHNRPKGCPFELEHFIATDGAADTSRKEMLRKWDVDKRWMTWNGY